MNIHSIKEHKNKFAIVLIVIFIASILYSVPIAEAVELVGGLTQEQIDSTALNALVDLRANVGRGVSVLAQWFQSVISWQQFGNVPVVQNTWVVVRNFVNMFFILILIIIAFGTIFNSSKYSIRSPGVLSRFIIGAVLINFSLVIGNVIIDISQVFTNLFINNIGDVSTTYAGGARFQAILDANNGVTGTVNQIFAFFNAGVLGMPQVILLANFNLVISIGMMFVIGFAFLASLIFSIVRIPILWALLIFSPVAWLMGILPATQGVAQKWWKHFLSWTFFLPIYLFMLLLGTILMRARAATTDFAFLTTGVGEPSVANMVAQDIFFYVLAVVILIGGLKFAMSAGNFVDQYTSATFGKITGGLRGAGGAVAGVTGLRSMYRGAKTGAKETIGRVNQEGFRLAGRRVFKGKAGEREQAAKFTDRFGKVAGLSPEFKAQRQFLEKANKEHESIQQQYALGRINEEKIRQEIGRTNIKDPRGYAYRKQLAQIGELDTPTLDKVLRSLSDNAFAIEDFARASKKTGFAKIPKKDLLEMAAAEKGGKYEDYTSPKYTSARRVLYEHIQTDSGALKQLEDKQFERGVTLFSGEKRNDYLKNVGKSRPDLIVEYNAAHPTPGKPSKTKLENMEILLKDAKAIGDMPVKTWGNKEFQEALGKQLDYGSPKTQAKFRENLEQSIQETGENIVEKDRILQKLVKTNDDQQQNSTKKRRAGYV